MIKSCDKLVECIVDLYALGYGFDKFFVFSFGKLLRKVFSFLVLEIRRELLRKKKQLNTDLFYRG